MQAQVHETHSAVVVALGDRVYKVKKPVRLTFLDFSTVTARRAVLARELALNRRLAPDVYLGVGAWHPPGTQEPGGEPVLVMRRMPDDRRLATLVAEGRATSDDVRAVGRAVAAFHTRAERSPAIDAAGAPDAVAAKLRADLEETAAIARGVLSADVVDDVGRLGNRYLAGRVPLLEHRVRARHIVDGHGDLLADDIFCLDDGPRILDCIEFDDRLRHGDVLADVAFLAMDLERLGAPELAAELLDAYAEFSAEHHPASLAHYYVAARALIRAKVTTLRVQQGDAGAAPQARDLLDLARSHLRAGRVTCTVVGGAPGAGKSTLAAALAPHLDAVVLSSDEVRKDLAGIPHTEGAEATYGAGIYTRAHTQATYAELLARAGRLLGEGTSVVLDASWSTREHRARAREVAAETSSDLTELECLAPPALAEARITRRRAGGRSASDATVAVAREVVARVEPWPEAVALDTTGPLDGCVEAARVAIG